MMELIIFLALFVAVASGYWLGRRRGRHRQKRSLAFPGQDYFQGLNYLLNEEPDKAIEIFTRAIELNGETIDIHLALGKLFRKQGEVDKAISIHEHLLGRPELSLQQNEQVRFELARDYLAAGVFDRAERLLLGLIESQSSLNWQCRRFLLHIFEQEKDWTNAIAIAEQLATGEPKYYRALAHYCCEIAGNAMASGDLNVARRTLKRALAYDRSCVRASLMQGDLAMKAGDYPEAIKAFRRVRHQDSAFLPEAIEKLGECYDRLGENEEFLRYLRKCFLKHPTTSVVLALADRLRQGAGDKEASYLIAQFIKDHPSFRGLDHLIEMHIDQTRGQAKENLAILQKLVKKLLDEKPVYQCAHCGFSGKKLHWACPSCQQWGGIKPIHGIEGE